MPALSMSDIAPVAGQLGQDQTKDFPTNENQALSDFKQNPSSLYEKYKDTLQNYKDILGSLDQIFNTLYSTYVDSSNLSTILKLSKLKAELAYEVSQFESDILHNEVEFSLKERIIIEKLISKLYLYLSQVVKNIKRGNHVLFPYNKRGVDEFNFLIPDDQKYWLTKGAIQTYYY